MNSLTEIYKAVSYSPHNGFAEDKRIKKKFETPWGSYHNNILQSDPKLDTVYKPDYLYIYYYTHTRQITHRNRTNYPALYIIVDPR